MSLRPPQEHIDTCLDIEKNQTNTSLYLECMNDKPMSHRETDQELRDGCILSHMYLDILKRRNT